MSKKSKQTKTKRGKSQSQKQQQSQNIEINLTQPKSKSRGYKPRLQNIEKQQQQQPQQPQTISNIPIPIPIPIYNQMPSQFPSQIPSQYIRQEEGISELLKQLLKTTTQPILLPPPPTPQPILSPPPPTPQPILLPPPPLSPQLIAEPIMRVFGVPLMQNAEPIENLQFDNRPGIRIPQLRPTPPSPQLRQPPQPSQTSQNYKFKSDNIFESDSDSEFYNIKSFDKPRSFDRSDKISTRVIERIPINVTPSSEKTTNENIPVAFLHNKDETLLNTINRDNNLDTLDKLNLFSPSKNTLNVNKITNLPTIPFEDSILPTTPFKDSNLSTIPFEDSNLPTTVNLKRIPDTNNESLLQKINNQNITDDEIVQGNIIIKEAEELSKNMRLETVKAKYETDDARDLLTTLQQENYIRVENRQKLFNNNYMSSLKFNVEQNNARKKLINIMYENQKNIIKNKTDYPENLDDIYETIKSYNNLDVKVTSPLELDNLLNSYFPDFHLNIDSITKAKKDVELKKAKQNEITKTSRIIEKNTEELTESIRENRDNQLALLRKKAEEDAKKAEEDTKKAEENAKKAEEAKQVKIQAEQNKILEDFTKLRDIIAKNANKMKQIDKTELKKSSKTEKEKWKLSENDAKVINKYLVLINADRTLANTRYYDNVDDFINKVLNTST